MGEVLIFVIYVIWMVKGTQNYNQNAFIKPDKYTV